VTLRHGASATDLGDVSRFGVFYGDQGRRNTKEEIFERVARGLKNENEEPGCCEVLLVLQALISGYEHLKTARTRALKQFAILQSGPALLLRRTDLVTGQNRASCRGNCSSRRTRTSGNGLVSRLQRGDHLLARHRRKRVDKLLDAVPPFEVVNQITERHSGALEHRGAP
jgi:hypothetical protein